MEQQKYVTEINPRQAEDRTLVIVGLRPRQDIPWLDALAYKVPMPIESCDKAFSVLKNVFLSNEVPFVSEESIIPWFDSDAESYILTQENGSSVEVSPTSKEAHDICDERLKTVRDELGITKVVLIESKDVVSKLAKLKNSKFSLFTDIIGVPNAVRATKEDIDDIAAAIRGYGIDLSGKDIIVSGGIGDYYLSVVEQLSKRYNAAPASCNGNWHIGKDKQYKTLQEDEKINLPLGEVIEKPFFKNLKDALEKIPCNEEEKESRYIVKPANEAGGDGLLSGTRQYILDNFLKMLEQEPMAEKVEKYICQQYIPHNESQEYSVYGTLCEEAIIQSNDSKFHTEQGFKVLCGDDSTLTFKRNNQKSTAAFIFDAQGNSKNLSLDLTSDLGKLVNKRFDKQVKIHSILKPNISVKQDGRFSNNGYIATQLDPTNPKHQAIGDFTRRVMNGLEDLRTGAFHLDLIRSNNKYYFLETTLRPGGSIRASDAVTTFSPLEVETLYNLCGKVPPKWKNPKATLAAGYLSDLGDDEYGIIKELERSNPDVEIKFFETLYDHDEATNRALIIPRKGDLKAQKRLIKNTLENITQKREPTITRASSSTSLASLWNTSVGNEYFEHDSPDDETRDTLGTPAKSAFQGNRADISR